MNRNKLLLRMFLTILLTFAVTLSVAATFLNHLIQSPDYWLKQVEQTGTYQNAHQVLLEKLSNEGVGIPKDVFAKAYTFEWTQNAVQEHIKQSFTQCEDCENVTLQNSEIEHCLTDYFEAYSREHHVLKDSLYEKEISETVEFANKTATIVTDVYCLSTMKEAGFWKQIEETRSAIRTILPVSVIITMILVLVLLLLQKTLYWIGSAVFASGSIVSVSALFGLHSIKTITISNPVSEILVTSTLHSIISMFLWAGIVLVAVGLCALTIHFVVTTASQSSACGQSVK